MGDLKEFDVERLSYESAYKKLAEVSTLIKIESSEEASLRTRVGLINALSSEEVIDSKYLTLTNNDMLHAVSQEGIASDITANIKKLIKYVKDLIVKFYRWLKKKIRQIYEWFTKKDSLEEELDKVSDVVEEGKKEASDDSGGIGSLITDEELGELKRHLKEAVNRLYLLGYALEISPDVSITNAEFYSGVEYEAVKYSRVVSALYYNLKYIIKTHQDPEYVKRKFQEFDNGKALFHIYWNTDTGLFNDIFDNESEPFMDDEDIRKLTKTLSISYSRNDYSSTDLIVYRKNFLLGYRSKRSPLSLRNQARLRDELVKGRNKMLKEIDQFDLSGTLDLVTILTAHLQRSAAEVEKFLSPVISLYKEAGKLEPAVEKTVKVVIDTVYEAFSKEGRTDAFADISGTLGERSHIFTSNVITINQLLLGATSYSNTYHPVVSALGNFADKYKEISDKYKLDDAE